MKPWIPECYVFLIFVFKQKCNINYYALFFTYGAETKKSELEVSFFFQKE